MHTTHLSVRRFFLFLPPLLLCNPHKNNYSRLSSPWSGKRTRTAFEHKTMYSKRLQCSPLELSLCVTSILKLKTCPHHCNLQFISCSSAASTVYWHSLSLGSGGFWSYHENCFQWWQILFLLKSQVKHVRFWGKKKKNLLMVTKWTKKAGKMLDTMAHSTFWVRSCWDSLCVCSN